MTDAELINWASKARREAAKVGSMHAYWDIIGDIEALVHGRQSLCTREQIETRVAEIRLSS